MTWHQWHHSAAPSMRTKRFSACARVKVAGSKDAQASGPRGAPLGPSSLVSAAAPVAGAVEWRATGVLAGVHAAALAARRETSAEASRDGAGMGCGKTTRGLAVWFQIKECAQ